MSFASERRVWWKEDARRGRRADQAMEPAERMRDCVRIGARMPARDAMNQHWQVGTSAPGQPAARACSRRVVTSVGSGRGRYSRKP
jgi:hypothetical protein